MSDPKPPVLRNPRRLLILLGVLLVVFVVLYIGVGATGFLRTQTKAPDPRMTETEAPLEHATQP